LIVVDGLNFALRRGTGIATYARGLVRTLASQGEAVGVLYDLPKPRLPGRKEESGTPYWFFQKLAQGRGRYLPKKKLEWLAILAAYLKPAPLRRREVVRVEGRDQVQWRGQEGRWDPAAVAFNAPRLYQAAFLQAYLTGRLRPVVLPREARLFHATTLLPVIARGIPNVVTVHDVIPLKLPESTRIDLRQFERVLRNVVSRYDQVVTVSEHSKSDIVEVTGCSPDKVRVVYQHVTIGDLSADVAEGEVSAHLAERGLHPGEYVLAVGALEPKKNHIRMIEAYIKSDLDIPLVVVGKRAWQSRDIVAALQRHSSGSGPGGRRRVISLDFVSGRELVSLYRGARCLFFCSLYEGFGLPVLEAMTLGCPVLTSTTSSMPEVARGAALLVDPYDVGAMRKALELLAGDERLRGELVTKGFASAAAFSAERHRTGLAEVYAEVLRRRA